jgi:transposase
MYGPAVRGVIESMNGARFVHDRLEEHGWDVLIADATKVKGLAPLACKTDKVDARVLAELSFRDLVPAIWLPTPELRAERERARWRLHLVKHRATLKSRVHSSLTRVRASGPRWLTCSASLAASCSPSWISPSRGALTCRQASS